VRRPRLSAFTPSSEKNVESENSEKPEREIMIMREIHVHIPAGLAEGQVLHIYLDEAGPEQQSAPSEQQAPSGQQQAPSGQQQALPDPIEAMLRRLEASPSGSPHLRGTMAELQAMGYRLGLPKPHMTTGQREKYIRVIDPASPVPAVAYMRAGFLIFARKYREVLAGLPGAIDERESGEIKFPIDDQHELEAARKVKG
jgi:hypothetical protein